MAIQPWEDDADIKRANRTAYIIHLRREGLTFKDIADELGLSIKTVRTFYYDEIAKIPAVEAALLRMEMSDRFDGYRKVARMILGTRNFQVSQKGQIISGPEGLPLADHDPALKALKLLIDIDKEEMRLWGLAMPAKLQVDMEAVQYTIVGVDPKEVLG